MSARPSFQSGHRCSADAKGEYADGEIFAMAGASPCHALIATTMARELGKRLKIRQGFFSSH